MHQTLHALLAQLLTTTQHILHLTVLIDGRAAPSMCEFILARILKFIFGEDAKFQLKY